MKRILLLIMTICAIAQAEMTLEEAHKIIKGRNTIESDPLLYFQAMQRIKKEITHYEIEEQIVDGYKVGERHKGMSKEGEILEQIYFDTGALSKITKENVTRDIKESCEGMSSTICSFLPTTIREYSWGGKEEVAFYFRSYVVSFIEVERILQELSTFKLPQNTPSIYQRAIRTIMQDIYKDIQKVYNNDGEFFELVKNYKTLTAKYANTPITQAMINPLKTSAQQQYNTLVKLEKQREKLEEQQREEIESRSETQAIRAKLKPLSDKKHELMKLSINRKIDDEKFREELDLINKEIAELMKELPAIPEPQGNPELDTQIATKTVELSLLVQELLFLEMQREIQKVEKMNQTQLTQYVIQHSVCSKKQLEEQEEQGEQCVDREDIIANAKKGWYDPQYLFNPFYPQRPILMLGVWEDEEGNRWSEQEFDRYNLIVKRAFALNDIAQALKNNDMQELHNSLKYFEQFTKNKERDFVSQLIKQIKRTYKIDDGYGD
ncbi:hypothetical protein [Helicobacter sp. 23-1046]